MRVVREVVAVGSLVSLLACRTTAEPEPAPAPPAAKTAAAPAITRLGAPLGHDAPTVTLAEVARAPATYADHAFTTTGTVTAVCQHMGCWMELRDVASEAHVKMAGHAFSVPRSAAGRRARIQGRLVKAGEPEPACSHGGANAGGCRAEAESQLGKPLPKLELVAEGVELFDS